LSSTYYTTYSTTPAVDEGALMGAMMVPMIISIIFAIVMIVAQWKIFTKAGEAGWKCLIPIYNLVVLFKIVGLSPWLILVALIPFVGWAAMGILMIVEAVKLGQAFGKSTGFIVGLIFLGPIFQLILAFGSSEYVGPQTKQA